MPGLDHLAALEHGSAHHDLLYHNLGDGPPSSAVQSGPFDAVILHGSLLAHRSGPVHEQHRRSLAWLEDHSCVKIALPLDEFSGAELLDEWLLALKVSHIFTCFDSSRRRELYPRMVDRAEFQQWHACYRDERQTRRPRGGLVPVTERPAVVLSRQHHRPYWLGERGQVEILLGAEVKRRAPGLGLSVNVLSPSGDPQGEARWLEQLAGCVAIVGAETGSSLLDRRGEIRAEMLSLLARCPGLAYAEVAHHLPTVVEETDFRQLGRHHIDAVLMGTCQVLVEGRYGGVLEAGVHYLAVRQDFSNLEEVLRGLHDRDAVREMTHRAHADVILGGKVSLRALADMLETAIERCQRPRDGQHDSARSRAAGEADASSRALESAPGGSVCQGADHAPRRRERNEFEELARRADCVVVLTESPEALAASPWLPGITSLSRHLPVFVVTEDAETEERVEEETPTTGWRILRVPRTNAPCQAQLLNETLCGHYKIRPIVMTDHLGFDEFLVRRYSALMVLVIRPELWNALRVDSDETQRSRLRRVLARTDLLVCPTERVRRELLERFDFPGATVVLAPEPPARAFFSPEASLRLCRRSRPGLAGTVFVPGPVGPVLDPRVLAEIVSHLPAWRFLMAGQAPVDSADSEWSSLGSLPAVKWLGDLLPQDWKWHAFNADVGLLPLRADAGPTEARRRALPLLACGLPVISPPSPGLEPQHGVVWHARSAEEFANIVGKAASTRHDPADLVARHSRASNVAVQGVIPRLYTSMLETMEQLERLPLPARPAHRLNVLVAYTDFETHIGTVREYLESPALLSQHDVVYMPAARTASVPLDLSVFDAVLIHYSLRLCYPDYISPHFVHALKQFGGYKALFIQDEYDGTEQARQWFRELGLHRVYTCVPQAYREKVYPSHRFPHVDFTTILTGYVPQEFEQVRNLRPMEEREVYIGYRGRNLAYWYGKLAQEKKIIGQRMRQICEDRGIPVDIEWDDSKRIYGQAWHEFHANCKAVLGSESGANVFDDHGDVRRAIEEALAENPDLTFDETFDRFLRDIDGQIVMAQISPRVFEAITLGSVLILFEGGYSGVLEPGVHYLSLKKDFSNVDDILEKLKDDAFLNRMAQRAYQDIIRSGRYSYRRFVARIDEDMTRAIRNGTGFRLIKCLMGERERGGVSRVTHRGYQWGHPLTEILSYTQDSYRGARTEEGPYDTEEAPSP